MQRFDRLLKAMVQGAPSGKTSEDQTSGEEPDEGFGDIQIPKDTSEGLLRNADVGANGRSLALDCRHMRGQRGRGANEKAPLV